MSAWQALAEDLWVYPDSCRVYALRGPTGHVLVFNAGAGHAAGRLADLNGAGCSVLLTHHFRDHSGGAAAFRRAGAQICAPYWERDHLSGGQPAFRDRPARLQYDMAWDHFAPVEPIAVDRWMMDYERCAVGGLSVEVVPAPGVSMGGVAYLVNLPDGRRLAFIGEMMAEAGKLARLSPLQHNYNDLIGGENLVLSWQRLLRSRPTCVYPSLGPPCSSPAEAAEALRGNLARFDALQPGYARRLASLSIVDSVEEVLPRLFRSPAAFAETYFIVGRSGRVLALDYGYDRGGIRSPARPSLANRRTLLHGAEALRRHGGDGRIATVLATHYHDDHICGAALLRRLFGTELWAGENFADLIERPDRYGRPAAWVEAPTVDRRLPLATPIAWEDVTLTLQPLDGHTRFSSLICVEFEGRRIAHIGDECFLHNALGLPAVPGEAAGIFTNHVYRNGLALGAYRAFHDRLRSFGPDLILSGHAAPFAPDARFWAMLDSAADAFDAVHRALMPLGADDPHFGVESEAARLEPLIIAAPGAAGPLRLELTGWVLNPFNRPARARLRFVTPPAGWSAAPLELILEPRERKPFATILDLAAPPVGRQPIALDLTVEGHPFGPVAEGWVAADSPPPSPGRVL